MSSGPSAEAAAPGALRGSTHRSIPGPPSRPPLRPAPEQREMLLIAGLAFFLNLIPGTALQWASARWGLALSQALFIAGPTALAIRWFYLDPAAVLPWHRPRPSQIAAALVGTLGLNHLLMLYGAWQDRVFPTPEVLRALFDGLLVYRGPIDFVLLLAVFALLPAICEEMLFRGFLQGGLVHLLERPGRGIVASAVIFGLFHLDPWRFVGITILGLFLGYLRHATGSLVPCVVAHAANNIVSVSLAASGRLEEGRLPGSALTAVVALLLLGAAQLLLRPGRTAGDSAARVL